MRLFSKYNLKRGQAMIMSTVFFVLISTTIIVGLSNMISASQRLTAQVLSSERSYYLAQSGAEIAAYNLLRELPIGEMPTIDGHQPVLDVEIEEDNRRITATADWEGVVREVEILLYASSTDSEILSWKEVR